MMHYEITSGSHPESTGTTGETHYFPCFTALLCSLLTFMINTAIDLLLASMKKTLLELADSSGIFVSLPKALQ